MVELILVSSLSISAGFSTLPNHKPIFPWSSSSYVLQLVFLRLRTGIGLGLSYFKQEVKVI